MRWWVYLDCDPGIERTSSNLIKRAVNECIDGITEYCTLVYLISNKHDRYDYVSRIINAGVGFVDRDDHICIRFFNGSRIYIEKCNEIVDIPLRRLKGLRGFICIDPAVESNLSKNLLKNLAPTLSYNEYLMIKANE